MFIFSKKTESIIVDLKKKSFALQNDVMSGNSSEAESVNDLEYNSNASSDQELSENKQQALPKKQEGYAGPDAAFKSVEINDNLF
jgi:uncharacterized protein YdeI (BOF family)